MSDPRPKELIHAEELMYNGKIEEALEIIYNFEKNFKPVTKQHLWALLSRGWAKET
ncbi:MAG: hypothetical protein ACFE94_19495 [Candidatus Hodarchaeota archaeon]